MPRPWLSSLPYRPSQFICNQCRPRPSIPIARLLPAAQSLQPSRAASHASEGRANKAAQGPGKRLGAKRAATEFVVPGNIIFRQRGTHWYPGENCGMGRDHTIFAKEKGYVVYYRDRWRNRLGERKYIGVVFERGMTLPRNPEEKRRRRLGLVGREREMHTMSSGEEGNTVAEKVDQHGLVADGKETVIRQQSKRERMKVPEDQMHIKPGYQYRESNWSIGRAAERAQVKVREYKRGDRFLAWRKLNARKAKNTERRSMTPRKKKGGKKVARVSQGAKS